MASGHPAIRVRPAASASPPPGWPVAFRGSAAIAAGLVTKKVLRGPRYLRCSPTPTSAAARTLDLRLRSLAAYRYVEGRGVLSGHSAAVLLGADCAPKDAPAEVTVPGGGQREHPVCWCTAAPSPGRRTPCRGVVVTSPDCGPATTWVGVPGSSTPSSRSMPWQQLPLRSHRHPRSVGPPSERTGLRDLRRAVALADRRAGSPMETRLRLILVVGRSPGARGAVPGPDDSPTPRRLAGSRLSRHSASASSTRVPTTPAPSACSLTRAATRG